MTTAYITKYALTDGIIKKEGTLTKDGYFDVPKYGFFNPGEFHLDFKSARKKAEEMQAKKIGSLRAQIERIESLCFNELV